MPSSTRFATFIIGFTDTYRGSQLEDQLVDRNIEFDRIEGVLVGSLPGSTAQYVDQSAATTLLRRKLTDGEIGCALAHRAAYMAFLSTKARTALILEDDARFIGDINIASFSCEVDDSAPRILQLFTHSSKLVASRSRHYQSAVDHHRIWSTHTVPLTTTAYFINRAAAQSLVNTGPRVSYVADWPPVAASQIAFSIVFPFVAEPVDDRLSTLNADRINRPNVDRDSKSRKAFRHIKSVSHVTWLSKRHHYGASYRTYWDHEIGRMAERLLAKLRGATLAPDRSESPLLSAFDEPIRPR